MLDPNTLASNLENMTPTGDEQAAIAAFSNAWSTYFAGASASGTPAVPGSFDTGIAAMRAAMTGFSAPNAGAPGIQAGISAFWGIISPLAATIWPLAPAVVLAAVTPPPGMSLIAADLLALFVQNLRRLILFSFSTRGVEARSSTRRGSREAAKPDHSSGPS